MMKWIAAVLLACLLPGAAACAEAQQSGWMKVVNCEEWVSLRQEPDAASDCLVQVPLDAVVANCSVKNKAFTYAEYNGLSGYIMSQYLEAIPVEQTTLGDLAAVDRGAWIPMRVGPFGEEAVIQWLAPGTRVEACVESVGGFVYGLCNGMKGYVLAEDLQAISDAPMQ